MLLSIALIVKNEEKNIEKCLQSFIKIKNKISSEIIVVDTGSTDNTINIAKKYTDKVYIHNWTGNFAEMRNISISYCKGEWILIVDADEILEDENTIYNFFNKHSKKYNSAFINFKNFISDNNNEYNLGRIIRLFKNTKDFKYKGIVHEQPVYSLPVLDSDIVFLHNGYSRNDYKLMKYKFERNKELLFKDLEINGENSYTYFQLAQTYSMANYETKALEYIKKAYEMIENSKLDQIHINHFYARCLLVEKKYEESIKVSKKVLSLGKEHIDFYYFIGKGNVLLENFKDSIQYYEKYLKMLNKKDVEYTITSLTNSKKEEVIYELLISYYKLENYDKLINMYEQIDNSLEVKKKLKSLYIESCIKNKQYDKIINFYKKTIIEEVDIQILDNYLHNLEEKDRKLFSEDLNGVKESLDIYFSEIIQESVSKIRKNINYKNFYQWKGKILKKLVIENVKNIEVIKGLNNNDIGQYINYLISDYIIIGKLISYSEENLFSTDLETIILTSIIENYLILHNSINDDDFKKLFYRLTYNKSFYLESIYNNPFCINENLINDLNDRFWIKIIKTIKTSDSLVRVKELRRILREYPNYKKIIEFIKEEYIITNITSEMEIEKDKLIQIAESYINNGNIDEAINILMELLEIFKFDKRILNDLAIANYFINNIEEALEYVTLSLVLDDEYIDSIYNLAIILEKKNRIEDSIFYFEKSLKITKDQYFKTELINIIEKLKYKIS